MENNIATINQGRPVYFSYARNSSRKPEWEHISDCVDTLLNTLTAHGLEYRVDVKDIGMGDKISKFEEEIGWNSEVVVIIFSDKYFRSMHCMYEFVQIKKALEQYPEKRLMCIKSGDFNLSDVNYIRDLERYWGSMELDYKDIEYHRLRNHSGTEIAAHENGFYLDEIRNLYSFFSAINYSNANSINYDGFVGDIVRYYKTTPKPKLTPKPKNNTPQPPQPSYTAQQPYNAYAQPYISQQQPYMAPSQPTPQVNVWGSNTPQPAKKKSSKVPIIILVLVLGLAIFFWAKNRTPNLQSEDISSGPYVDLGLPSGTLWASCNIGANAPEEYGDYFAWGETETKSDYESITGYKFGIDGELDEYTKYNHFWDADESATLDWSDDAATVNWGSDWRMPTQQQFKELYDECTWRWTSCNGKNGYRVYGPNGNSIFLPAAGDIDAYLYDEGSKGFYWSASLQNNCMWFNSLEVNPNVSHRPFFGRPVRPVRCR